MNDYKKIEKAISFLEDHHHEHPSIAEQAQHLGISSAHYSRLFKKFAGVTPKQFSQYLSLDFCKRKLEEDISLLDISLEGGFSSTSRIHDLFISFEGMSPGEYKQQGKHLIIDFAFVESPFGECLIGQTSKGICYLGFVLNSKKELLSELMSSYPHSIFKKDIKKIEKIADRIFDYVGKEKPYEVLLKVRGTNFQIKVWEALLRIPFGERRTYQDIANEIGNPKGVRAVASAIANNKISFLIPCHRVIAKSGKIHQYRWGSLRKKALLGWESARRETL